MPHLRIFLSKLKNLLSGESKRDLEIDDEIGSHVALLARRYVDQGMTPEEAESAARRQFGKRREIGTFFTLSTLVSDLRFAVRQLRRDPTLAITAVCSLALGIGANTAIFSVAKKVLFDTLPVRNAHEMRLLTWTSGPERPVPPVWGDVSATKAGGLSSTVFSYAVLEEMRKQPEVFESLWAFKDIGVTASVDGHPELINGELLSGDAFAGLGVEPILGRVFGAGDDNTSGAPVAVISECYWAERFGRSPSSTRQNHCIEWGNRDNCRHNACVVHRLNHGQHGARLCADHNATRDFTQSTDHRRRRRFSAFESPILVGLNHAPFTAGRS
jgi:MacB-like periplasmic core domain